MSRVMNNASLLRTPPVRWRMLSAAAATLLLLAASVTRGQDSPPEPSPDPEAKAAADSGRRDESLTHWQYYAEVPLGPAADAPYADFLLTPAVFDGARYDLADLRLYDADQQEVPYALRVRTEKSELSNLAAGQFNRLQQEDGSRQVSLDLGDEQDVQHNEVEILTTGGNFRRRAVVEGGDDGKQWHQLATGYLLDFRHNGETFRDNTIDYPPSRFRYLRVTVHPDPQQDKDDSWELSSVNVRRRVRLPGENVTRPVTYTHREPVRTPDGPGSQWLIDLGGASVPCTELLVEIASDDFVRDWRVEAAGPDEPGESFRQVASGTWRRKAGEKETTFSARLPDDLRAARLKLLVTDYRNPPLEITSIKSRAPARQVVLPARQENLKGPLRLYFGNSKAEQPRYDFARNLPQRLEPKPERVELGERQDNPVYQPEPPPLTERLPWLVHGVLAVAVAVLAALIASLAWTALKNSPAEAPQGQQG
jgi:hypothetical protein